MLLYIIITFEEDRLECTLRCYIHINGNRSFRIHSDRNKLYYIDHP